MKKYTRAPVPAVRFANAAYPITADIMDKFLNGSGRFVKIGDKTCISIPVHGTMDDRVLVFPGEWIVKENDGLRRYSNEEFVEEFTEVKQ